MGLAENLLKSRRPRLNVLSIIQNNQLGSDSAFNTFAKDKMSAFSAVSAFNNLSRSFKNTASVSAHDPSDVLWMNLHITMLMMAMEMRMARAMIWHRAMITIVV
jgi:hypothetical protein